MASTHNWNAGTPWKILIALWATSNRKVELLNRFLLAGLFKEKQNLLCLPEHDIKGLSDNKHKRKQGTSKLLDRDYVSMWAQQ